MNLPVDGSEDGLIHCFKEKEPCSLGKDRFKSHMEMMENDMESSKTLCPSTQEITESDARIRQSR